jgi:hypothetical protein
MKERRRDTSIAKLTIAIQGADDTSSVVTANSEGPDATVLEHGLDVGSRYE